MSTSHVYYILLVVLCISEYVVDYCLTIIQLHFELFSLISQDTL